MNHSQQGSTLLLALVFMLLLSIAATAAIRLSTQSQQINAAFIDYQRAFQAAERGLREAETQLNQYPEWFPQADGCANGICFFGTYDPGHSCTLNSQQKDKAEANSTLFQHINGSRSAFQVHFQCFRPRLGLIASQLSPPPASGWQAVYQIISTGHGESDGSQVQLRSEIVRDFTIHSATLPAIFSVRQSIHSVAGSDVRAFFCGDKDCTSEQISNGESPSIFDLSKTKGISYGAMLHADGHPAWGWENLEFYVAEDDMAQCLEQRTHANQQCHLDTRMPSWVASNRENALFCGVDGQAKCVDNSTEQTEPLTGDQFFHQYFGDSRENVMVQGLTVDAKDVRANLTNIRNNLLIIEGDLDLDSITLPADENLTVIVRGTIKATKPLVAPVLGLLYTEQDLEWNSSQWLNSAIAVEGNAKLFNSLRIEPAVNPMDLLSKFANKQPLLNNSMRTSWLNHF